MKAANKKTARQEGLRTSIILILIAGVTGLALYMIPYISSPINEHNIRTELNSINLLLLGDAQSQTFTNKSLTTDAEIRRLYPVASSPVLADRAFISQELQRQGYKVILNRETLIEATKDDYRFSLSLTTAAQPETPVKDNQPGDRVLVSLIKY